MRCILRLLPAVILAVLVASFGCSKKSESTGQDPNKELTNEQKQHIDDLNKQRREEWGK